MSTPSPYCQTLEPPQYVYWYHNDKIINYDTKRTRVSFDLGEDNLIKATVTTALKFSGENTKKTSSRLVIASVQKSDSGNYTCRCQQFNWKLSKPYKTLHFLDPGWNRVNHTLEQCQQKLHWYYILIIHRENVIKDVCFQHHPCRAQYHLCICQPRWVCICVCICICICTYL